MLQAFILSDLCFITGNFCMGFEIWFHSILVMNFSVPSPNLLASDVRIRDPQTVYVQVIVHFIVSGNLDMVFCVMYILHL